MGLLNLKKRIEQKVIIDSTVQRAANPDLKILSKSCCRQQKEIRPGGPGAAVALWW